MATIGIVAGAGKLPAIFSDEARKRGDKVIGIGLKGVTEEDLGAHVDKLIWIELGAIQKTVFSIVAERIKKIALLGKLRKDFFFKREAELDQDTRRILDKLNDKKDYSMLNEAAKFLKPFGIEIMDPTLYMQPFIPDKGVLTKRSPTADELADIEYGRGIANTLAGFDIGQTVIVKSKTVVALEAVEGTDETIKRAGQYARKGFVVVKSARPQQDMRFDVPLVGLETVEAIVKSGGTALALEAGRTFLIDRPEIIKLADSANLAITII